MIQVGDAVALHANATYYTGGAIPSWAKQDQWIVSAVSGDRVVLGKNASGTNDINSPVAEKYLTVVRASASQGASSQTASSEDMVISERGVALIAKYEGCYLDAYKCPAGVWTIGYGHVENVKPGDKLASQDAAKRLLREDLARYGASVNSYRRKGIIAFPLKQCQFDALTSFCYNCGAGSLQKLVTGRDAATIADKMLEYNKGGGRVLLGLVRRREEERALFLS